MASTPEYTEVVAGSPELLFGAVKDHHDWFPKLAPHVFPNAERHEGEGHTGSVYHYDVHEDHHDAHGGSTTVKVVMEDYNPETLSYVIDYQADPRYSHLKWHVRMLPGPESPNTTSIKWRLEYMPYDEKTGAPDDILALNLVRAGCKDLAAHLEAESKANEAEKPKGDLGASTPEYTEVVAGTPELLFGAMKDHHEWFPKLVPHVFHNAERHEGEGHTGSVYQYDVHEDHHDTHGGATTIKLIMEDYNPETLSYVVDYQGDPRYSHLKWHIRMLPGPDPNTTSLKWRIEYLPYEEETGAPDDIVALNLPRAGFKDLAAHLEEESKAKEHLQET